MKIRDAKVSDAGIVMDMLIRTPELQGSGEMDAVYSNDYVLDCIKDKEMNVVLLAEVDNEVVGMLIAETWKKKKYSFLVNFVVMPEYRNKGIGNKLYSEYETYCKKKKLKTITALVQMSNKKMLSFCNKKGFKTGHRLFFLEKDI